MPVRKQATLIGTNKGGIGKTMIALLMSLMYRNAKYPLKIIEIDNEQKLSAMLGNDPEILSIPATQDIELTASDRFAAETHFNEVFEAWSNSDSLTDLGANMTTALFSWIRYCEIAELAIDENISFRFVACASPDHQAIKSALESLKSARETLGRDAELYLVLNQISEGMGFTPHENNPDFVELMRMRDAKGICVIEMPYCDSRLNEFGRAMKMNPVEIIQNFEMVAKAASLDRVSTSVHKKKLMKWLEAAADALEPLRVVENLATGQAA